MGNGGGMRGFLAVGTTLLSLVLGYGIYQFRDVPTDVASIKTEIGALNKALEDRRVDTRDWRSGVERRLLNLEGERRQVPRRVE